MVSNLVEVSNMIAFTVSELVVSRYRATLAQILEAWFAVGFMVLSLLAYVTRDWRNLQLAISIPAIITLPIYW